MFRKYWRGPEEWMAEGLPIKSSTSTDAIKMFDATLTQLVGWYDDPQLEGIESTVNKMMQADPEFVLGRTLAIGLELLGTGKSIRLDIELRKQLNLLKELIALKFTEPDSIEWRELKHVEAIDRFANDDMTGAALVWEKILERYPTDMMALKFAHDTYFYLGAKENCRDSIARVMPYWIRKNRTIPLQSYLHGMYAFGLEETHFYLQAEKQAKLGLEKFPPDAWSTHALAHVYEMSGRSLEGLGFLSRTVKDWNRCNYLACHNYWHWALYHIDRNEPDAALELFENEIGPRVQSSGAMLDFVDASSLLYRIELLHPKQFDNVTRNWRKIYDISRPHLVDHITGFNDAHFTMACLGVNRTNDAEQLLESLSSSVVMGDSATIDGRLRWYEVTKTLIEAMIEFKRENYTKTVELLLPIRYDIVKIGGSDAQRDVFNQLLIVAALKSNCGQRLNAKGNSKLLPMLINERRAFKGVDDVVITRLSPNC